MAVSAYGFQQFPSGAVRVGPGYRRYRGGSVRVGAVPRRPAAAAARPSAPGVGGPPPGYYNPERDFALSEAQRRGYSTEAGMPEGYAEEGADVNRERGEHDYATSLGQIGTREARRRQDAATAIAALHRHFANLATAQTGNANRAGVLQGGALIASAAARAGNQTRGEEPINTDLQRGLAGDDEDRKLLAQEWGPSPVVGASWEQLAAGGAGRKLTDLATEVLHGRANQSAFEKDTGIAKGTEAAELGYEPPAKIAMRRHARRHRRR